MSYLLNAHKNLPLLILYSLDPKALLDMEAGDKNIFHPLQIFLISFIRISELNKSTLIQVFVEIVTILSGTVVARLSHHGWK